MPQTPSYEAIWFGFVYVDHLILMLDFAAWLNVEFDGEPDATAVSILKEPQEALDERVDAYLTEHRGELTTGYLKCPTCGTQYSQRTGYTTCPTKRAPRERTTPPLPYKKCNTPLEEVITHPKDDDPFLREQAGFALAGQGDIVSRRHVVCAWLIQELHRGKPVSDDDVQLPLRAVREHITAMMESQVDQLNHRLAQLDNPLFLSGRRNLWPVGETLQERYLDYRSVRDGLISGYTRLLGIATEHPEFVEAGEEYPKPREFSLPIPVAIERLRPPDHGGFSTPDVRAALVQLMKQVDALSRSLVPLTIGGDWDELPARFRAAFSSFKFAEDNRDPAPKTDREAYEWLKEHSERSEDDKLPSYDTWSRNLRGARKRLGKQKNRPRSGRSGGSSIASQHAVDTPRSVSD